MHQEVSLLQFSDKGNEFYFNFTCMGSAPAGQSWYYLQNNIFDFNYETSLRRHADRQIKKMGIIRRNNFILVIAVMTSPPHQKQTSFVLYLFLYLIISVFQVCGASCLGLKHAANIKQNKTFSSVFFNNIIIYNFYKGKDLLMQDT